MTITASKTQRFYPGSGENHVLIDAGAGADCDDLAITVHNVLRLAGLLKFEDPEDDVPFSACSTGHRNSMETVARLILDGIEIDLEMEQLE